jgi:hypothetical protein
MRIFKGSATVLDDIEVTEMLVGGEVNHVIFALIKVQYDKY